MFLPGKLPTYLHLCTSSYLPSVPLHVLCSSYLRLIPPPVQQIQSTLTSRMELQQLIVFSLYCTICFRCSIGSSLTACRHANFILSKKQIATLFWPHISPSINPFIIPCIAKSSISFFLISTLTSLFLFNLPGL